jgi:hypothetical protein
VYTGFWWGNLKERDNLEESDLNWRILLKWILKTRHGEESTGLIWLRIRTGGGFYISGNKIFGSSKFGEILE